MNSPDTVLVVDDDAGIRELMASALRFAGFDVRLAGDAPQALDSLARHTPTSSFWMWDFSSAVTTTSPSPSALSRSAPACMP